MPKVRGGGIVFPEKKAAAGMTIMPMAVPEKVYIPMKQAPGEVYLPIVGPGDRVRLGQLIAEAGSPGCAPIHSSVSGEMISIDRLSAQMDKGELYMIIKTDGRQELDPEVKPPRIRNSFEFFEAVRGSGIVDFGRNRTPLVSMLERAEGREIKALIINGTEPEPYVSVCAMNMLSFPEFLRDGALTVMERLGIPAGIIAVGSGMTDAIDMIASRIAGESRLSLFSVRNFFPSGNDTVLIHELTGELLPPGKAPEDLGYLVLGAQTVIKLAEFLTTGMPLVSRSLTVDGDAVNKPRNVEAPIGTHAADILEFCGGEKKPIRKMIIGGPVTGRAIESREYSVGKDDSAMLCFSELYAPLSKESACIGCMSCADSCPMSLMPRFIMRAAVIGDADELRRLAADSCLDCGACSYVCPARIALGDRMKYAKSLLAGSEAQDAEAGSGPADVPRGRSARSSASQQGSEGRASGTANGSEGKASGSGRTGKRAVGRGAAKSSGKSGAGRGKGGRDEAKR